MKELHVVYVPKLRKFKANTVSQGEIFSQCFGSTYVSRETFYLKYDAALELLSRYQWSILVEDPELP